MRKDFRFPSLTRKDIAYYWRSNYHTENNGFFRQPASFIAPEANEYVTYGDGMTQHGPAYAVPATEIQDFLLSLASYLRENPEDIESVSYRWHTIDIRREAINFYKFLKYDPDKTSYYNSETLKKSSAPSRRHDKRWAEIPNYADGSLKAVFFFFCPHYQSALERYGLLLEIKKAMEWILTDRLKTELIGVDFNSESNKWIERIYDAVDELVNSYRFHKSAIHTINYLIEQVQPKKEEVQNG